MARRSKPAMRCHNSRASPPIFQHRNERKAADRPVRWYLLLSGDEIPRLLHVGEDPKARGNGTERTHGIGWDVLWQVHEGQQVHTAHNGAHLPGPVCTVQDLAEAGRRAAVPVRQQCGQVGHGPHHGKHPRVPGRDCHVDERRAARVRCGGQIYQRLQASRSARDGVLPSSGHRRIHSIGGKSNLGGKIKKRFEVKKKQQKQCVPCVLKCFVKSFHAA